MKKLFALELLLVLLLIVFFWRSAFASTVDIFSGGTVSSTYSNWNLTPTSSTDNGPGLESYRLWGTPGSDHEDRITIDGLDCYGWNGATPTAGQTITATCCTGFITWQGQGWSNGTLTCQDGSGCVQYNDCQAVTYTAESSDCTGLTPDVDSDGDGICDRCDFAPYTREVGKYLYLTDEIKDPNTLAVIGQRVTYYPYAIYSTMPYSAQAAETTLIGSANGRDYPYFSTFPQVGEVPPCVCNQPCAVQSLNNQLLGGDQSTPGTEAPPVGQTGTTVPQTSETSPSANPTGNTQPGEAAPASGTDSDMLKSIADNAAKTTDNLNTLNNNLSSQLADLQNSAQKTNTDLGQIANPPQDVTDSALNDFNSTSDTNLNSYNDQVNSDIQTLTNTDQMPSSSLDGTWNKLTNVITPGTCQDLAFPIGNSGRTLTITCDFSDKLKTILGFLLSFYTIYFYVNTIYTQVVPSGTPSDS